MIDELRSDRASSGTRLLGFEIYWSLTSTTPSSKREKYSEIPYSIAVYRSDGRIHHLRIKRLSYYPSRPNSAQRYLQWPMRLSAAYPI